MKRVCFAVLAALMVLSLVGCGDMTGLPDTLPTLEPFNLDGATPTPEPADTSVPAATAVPTVTPEPVPVQTPAAVKEDASGEGASEETASGEASEETASEELASEELASEEPASEEPEEEPEEEPVEEPEEEFSLVPGTYEGENESVLTVEEDGSCAYETLVSGTIGEAPVSAWLTFRGTLENGEITFDSVWFGDIDLTQVALSAGLEDASGWEAAAELLYACEE